MCHVCFRQMVYFAATFPDGTVFLLCDGCTDDLCGLQDTFFLDVTITSAQDHRNPDLTDMTAHTDPAESDR